MTNALRKAWARRRVAYRVWLALPTPGGVPERILHQCTSESKRAWRAARAQHRRRAEDKCVYLYNTQRHTRAAHRAIDALKHAPDQPSISMLRHPDTDADCVAPAAKADALRAKYASMAQEKSPAHPAEQAQRDEAREKVANARRTSASTSQPLDARFDAAEVAAGIKRMANHKTPGNDNLPAELVKHSGPAGVALVTKLFNACWTAERTPSSWRQGIIVSIYKADDPTDCSKYRPLTLLPVLDKLYATLLTRRMESKVPLHDHQYAFRKARGTLNALFNLTAALRIRTRAGMPTFATFFDAAKSYDCDDTLSHMPRRPPPVHPVHPVHPVSSQASGRALSHWIGEVAGSSPGGASFSLKHLCKDLVLSFIVTGSRRVVTLS